jgi:RimJ/RimL family protein N-acetyltransferase
MVCWGEVLILEWDFLDKSEVKMHGLLIDNDKFVAEWTYRTFNIYPQQVDKAFGIIDSKGKLCGGILFQNFNGVNLELSYYGPRTVSCAIVRIIARTAIEFFNVSRLTVVTSRRNKRLIRGLMKLGFKLEGIQRCFYGHEDNKKNTGVRLAVFRDQLLRVAHRNISERKNVI